MEAVDYLDRWTYKGSLSEPPCEQYAYWNVVRTTYPIELERFDYFKEYLSSKKEYLGGYKNNRKIQTVTSHHVQYVSANFFSKIQIMSVVLFSLIA
jgi:carbonic anhydrase